MARRIRRAQRLARAGYVYRSNSAAVLILRRQLLALASLGAVLVFLAAAIAVWDAPSLVRRDALPPHVDAVVALSGLQRADTTLSHGGAARLNAALQLVKSGLAPELVTTRISRRVNGRELLSDSAQGRLIRAAGVHPTWHITGVVHSTRDEAVATARLLRPEHRYTIAVVTSPFHTRRACRTFEAVGFRVYCVATQEPLRSRRTAWFYWYERAATWKYRILGWLK